jgi:hypothetical protein
LITLPNLPESPEMAAEWQDAVDAASIVLNLAYAEQGRRPRESTRRLSSERFALIERGKALGIESREDGFEER